MLEDTDSVISTIVEHAPTLATFERTEYIDDESNNAIILFEKEYEDMDTLEQELATEKYEVNHEVIANKLNCESSQTISSEKYSVRFIFEDWDLS